MLKKNFVLCLVLTLGLVLFFGLTLTPKAMAAEKKPAVVTLLLCPLGCGPLAGDTILGSLIARKEPDLFIRVQETPGYVYNLREMGRNKRRWKNTMFGTDDDSINFAKIGDKEPFKEFYQESIGEKFQLLYGEGYWIIGHYFITLNPKIKKISDLKGKKIAVGLRSQTDWGMNPRIDLEFGYGITPKNAKIYHIGPSKMVEELIDGKVDAITMGGAAEPFFKTWLIAGGMRALEASGRKLFYLGLDPEVIEKLNKRFGTSYLTVTVPAGTFPNQTEDLIVGADRGYKTAHETFDPDLAYKVIMAISKYAPDMKELHGLWKIWSPNLMVSGLSETNANPGAIRAYKELGWWDLRKKYKPVVFWWEK